MNSSLVSGRSFTRTVRGRLLSILVAVALLVGVLAFMPGVASGDVLGLDWQECTEDVDFTAGCPEPPDVEIMVNNPEGQGDQILMGQDSTSGESAIQNMATHAASAELPPASSYTITFSYGLNSWDAYNTPSEAGTGYWDSFSVSVSQEPYWRLSLSDPITPSNLPGLAFIWGGNRYGDGVLDTNSSAGETFTETVPGDPNLTNYLNVALDTATQPNANHAFPSYGGIRIHSVLANNPESQLELTVDTDSVATGDQHNIKASPSFVPVDDAQASMQPSTEDAQSAPLEDINIIGSPLDDLNIIGSPLDDLNIIGSPLDDLNIIGSPLDDLNIIGSPLEDINIIGSPLVVEVLGSIALGDVRLRSGDWESRCLKGTALEGVPLQNVTLKDLLLLSPNAPCLGPPDPPADLTFGDIDWSQTPIGDVGAAGVYLGRVRARDLAPGPGGTGGGLPPADVGFCKRFELQGFTNCGSRFGGLDASIFAMQVAGVNLESFPIGSMKANQVNLARALMLAIPLRGDDAQKGIHNTVGLGSTPFGSVRYNELSAANKSQVFDCTIPGYCEGNPTVADAANQVPSRLKATALVHHLGTFNTEKTIWTPAVSLGEVTLGQILYSLVLAPDVPMEETDLSHLVQYGGGEPSASRRMTYTLEFSNGADALTNVELSVTMMNSLPAVQSHFFYVPGSAQVSSSTPPGSTTQEPSIQETSEGVLLKWTLAQVAPGSTETIEFDARPGLRIGTMGSHASVVGTRVHPAIGTLTEDATGPAVSVLESFESNGTQGSATTIAADNLYFSHIGQSGDVDFFKFFVPEGYAPGTRVSFSLSHLTFDGDLVVFLPANSSTSQNLSGAPLEDLNIIGSPLEDLNIIGSPLEEQELGLTNKTSQTGVEVLEDVPVLASLPVGGISANRSIESEAVDLPIPGGLSGSDFFLVQVTGYMGAASDLNYVLRVKVTGPVAQPASCPARTFPFAGQGVASTIVPDPSQIQGKKTLILINKKRLGDLYGATAANDVVNAVVDPSFLNRADVAGFVIPLDTGGLLDEYAAWDAASGVCSPEAANNVVSAINSHVRGLLDQETETITTLENVVIVGTDSVTPFARLNDDTDIFNQRSYADALTFTTKGFTENNSLFASQAQGTFLSDNPYADFNPIPWRGEFVYVPDLALGRLGETPEQIVGQITRFKTFDGKLDAASGSLTTAYNFMTDMGQQILSSLAGDSLINETWTATGDLKTKFLNKTTPPKIVAKNGHGSHFRLLGAAGNSANDLSDTLRTADVSAGSDLTRLVLFSMACNLGLNVEDFLIGIPATEDPGNRRFDWTQAYFSKNAAGLGTNSGFGYGDKVTVAYSERLMVLFAKNLKAGMTTGDAIRFAKQTFFAESGPQSEYNRKSLSVLTGWGLPMWRLPSGFTPPASPPPVTPALDTTNGTGLIVGNVSATPNLVQTTTGDGSYFTDNNAAPAVAPLEPVTARTEVNVTSNSPNTLVPGGVFIKSADFTTVSGFDPVIAVPTPDLARLSPEPQMDGVIYPNGFWTLGTELGPTGKQNKLNLLSTSFRQSGFSGGKVVGSIRKYSKWDALVFYRDPQETDRKAPIFKRVEGSVSGSPGSFLATFEAELVDETPSDKTDIQAVWILLTEGNKLRSVKLSQIAGTDRWIKTNEPVASKTLRFSGQAVDEHSNVARTANKGPEFGDSIAPTITITTPAAGATYDLGQAINSSFSCTDNLDSAPTCEGPSTVDTSAPGKHTFEVRSADEAGNVAIKEVFYYVRLAPFVFFGFNAPLTPNTQGGTDNPNQPLTSAKSGQAIPLKWQYKAPDGSFYRSLTINDLELQWRGINCDGSRSEMVLPDDPSLLFVDVGLKYVPGAEEYYMVIKTPKTGWEGQCRRFVMIVAGMESHFHDFKFK